MTRIRFQEIKYKAVHRWVDGEGKKRQLTRVFSQTLNPFNKNTDGSIKTEQQIKKEVFEESVEWLKDMENGPHETP